MHAKTWRCFAILMAMSFAARSESPDVDYRYVADRIIRALHLQPGERVLIRYDPTYFQELVFPLRRAIREVAAVDLAAVEYVQSSNALEKTPSDSLIRRTQLEAHLKAFEHLLDSVDIYLWLPAGRERDLYDAESEALRRWLAKGETRRQIHFHWRTGSIEADGLPGEHTEDLDRIYQDALDIDYKALSMAQDRAISLLQSGEVRVRTPAGTDLRFRVGNRPFNKQNGDGSTERVKMARIPIDREIELPAGALRVAPLEDTVNGRIIIPVARFEQKIVKDLYLEIRNGVVTRVEAKENGAVAEAALKEAGDAANRFREFGLGFNPKLIAPQSSTILPYYGYGTGVVRLSLGDNQELGGNVRGGFVRWFFFPDATVEVEGQILVQQGKLIGHR